MEYWYQKKKDAEILYVLMWNNGDDSSNNYNDESLSYTHSIPTCNLLYMKPIHPLTTLGGRYCLYYPHLIAKERKGMQVEQLVQGHPGS